MSRPAASLLAAALLAAACSREPRAWKAAAATHTVEAYEQFLAAHPAGDQAAEARRQIEEIEYQAAARAPAAELRARLESFVVKYPQGRFSPRARRAIEEIDFYSAAGSGLLADLEVFLQRHPQGVHAADARARLERVLAGRPAAFRGLRTIRLRIERSFVAESFDPERDFFEEPFEPDLDLAAAPSAWLRQAGLQPTTDAAASADGELWIVARGDPLSETYDFDAVDFPVSRFEGAELSGRIRLQMGAGPRVERRFSGEIWPPEQVTVTVHAVGGLPFNQASDAPFDRAARLPGSYYERLLETLCEGLGPAAFRPAGGSPAPTSRWIDEARARQLLDRCESRAGESRVSGAVAPARRASAPDPSPDPDQ